MNGSLCRNVSLALAMLFLVIAVAVFISSPPALAFTMSIEAEKGVLYGPMAVIADSHYSGFKGIQTPDGANPTASDLTGTGPTQNYGRATYALQVPGDGTYYMLLKGHGTKGGSEFRIWLADGQSIVRDVAVAFDMSEPCEWRVIEPAGVPLFAGRTYSLVIMSEGSQDGAVLDAFLVTDDPSLKTMDGQVSTSPTILSDPSVEKWDREGITPFGYYFKHRLEYVSAATGDLIVTHPLLNVPGRGDMLDLRLLYASSAHRFGLNDYRPSPAPRWFLDLPWLDLDRDDGKEYIHLAGGGAYEISWERYGDATFRFVNHESAHLILQKNGHWDWLGTFLTDSYDLWLNDGTQYHFPDDYLHSLAWYKDRNNNQVTLHYANGRVSEIIDPTGARTVSFEYDPSSGHLTSVSLGSRTFRMAFTHSPWKLTVTEPESQLNTVYTYSGEYIWKIEYPGGGMSTYDYAILLFEDQVYPGLSFRRNVVVSQKVFPIKAESKGLWTTFAYTVFNTEVSPPYISDVSSEVWEMLPGMYRKKNIKYTACDGLVTSEIVSDSGQLNYSKKSYGYDANHQITGIGDYAWDGTAWKQRFSTRQTYDDWGNVTSTTDAVGHTRYFSYLNTSSANTFNVPAGGPTFTNSFCTNTVPENVKNLPAGMAEAFDGKTAETYYLYDSQGKPLEIKRKLGANWIHTHYDSYDGYGNPTSITEDFGGPKPKTTLYGYDALYYGAYLTSQSNTLEKLIVDGVERADVKVETLDDYDFSTGNRTGSGIRATQNNGSLVLIPKSRYETGYEYDILNRLTKVTFSQVGADPRDFVSIAYNDANNTVTFKDELAISKLVRRYDGLDRLVAEDTYLNVTDGSPYSTKTVAYNWLGKPDTETLSAGATTYVTGYEYDLLGRLTKQTYPDGTYVAMRYDDLYDSNGDLVPDAVLTTIFDERNPSLSPSQQNDYYKKELVHDYAGRLKEVREYPGTPTRPLAVITTRYSCDEAGHLKEVRNDKGNITSYLYDDLGRLERTTFADGTTLRNEYDNHGNVRTVTKQDGRILTNEYDAANRLVAVKDGTTTLAEIDYDPLGNRARVRNGQTGITTLSIFDERNRLGRKDTMVDGKTYSVVYTYHPTSVPRSIVAPDGRQVDYAYDNLNRIDTVNLGATALADYSFRPDSLLESVSYANGITTTQIYYPRPRIQDIIGNRDTTELFKWHYGYDQVGDVTVINSDLFDYDGVNRLFQVEMRTETRP